MHTRRLTPQDAAAYQAIRLGGLRDNPTAFASSFEEECDLPLSVLEARLAFAPDGGLFGAFEGDVLVGVVGLGREGMAKLSHKGFIWGMYVKPDQRGNGVGKALLLEALSLARSIPGMLQVNLGANAGNTGAIRLYESLGFRAYGREPGAMRIGGVLHDEIHMSLHLGNARP